MVSLEHIESECHLAKRNVKELSFSRFPFRGNWSSIRAPVYKLGKPPVDNEQALLDFVLLAQWEEFSCKGILRYDVTSSAKKVVYGGGKFVAQLIEMYDLCFPAEAGIVTQRSLASDCSNLKILSENILFCVTTGDMDRSEFVLSAAVPSNSIIFVVNENPVAYGHIFLVPYNFHHSMQFLESLESILRVAVEINNCSFQVFYDSPGSNFNHMSFQACYLANQFPVECWPMTSIFHGSPDEDIHVHEIVDYPVRTLVFSTEKNLKSLAAVVSEACSLLPGQIAKYNFLISDSGRKIYIFLQGKSSNDNPNLCSWECAGHFVFNMFDEFEQATEEILVKRMTAVSLDDEVFQTVKELCCDVANKLAG